MWRRARDVWWEFVRSERKVTKPRPGVSIVPAGESGQPPHRGGVFPTHRRGHPERNRGLTRFPGGSARRSLWLRETCPLGGCRRGGAERAGVGSGRTGPRRKSPGSTGGEVGPSGCERRPYGLAGAGGLLRCLGVVGDEGVPVEPGGRRGRQPDHVAARGGAHPPAAKPRGFRGLACHHRPAREPRHAATASPAGGGSRPRPGKPGPGGPMPTGSRPVVP